MKGLSTRGLLVAGALLLLAPPTPLSQPGISLTASVREGATLALDAEGALVVMGNGDFVEAVDVSDPEAPVLLGRLDQGRMAFDLVLAGDFAYVRVGDGLRIVDVSDPAAPTLRGSYVRTIRRFAVEGDFLYASTIDGLIVVDVSDPDSPTQVGAIAANDLFHLDVAYPFVYGVEDFGGDIYIFDVSDPTAPTLRTSVAVGGAVLQRVEHDDGVLFAAGLQTLHAYDVTDPDDPALLGSVDVPAKRLFNMEAVQSAGDLVLLRRREEVYLFDSSDPSAMSLVGELDVAYGGDAHFRGTHAFLGGDDLGLLVLDVTDPANPVEAGRFENGGNLRAAASDGDHLYLSGGFHDASESVRTYSLEDPNEPHLLARADVGDWDDLRIRDGLGYASYLLPGLFVYSVLAADLSDPAAPTVLSTCDGCAGQSYDFTGAALGDSTFFLNSTFDGVYSVDIRDPQNIALLDRIVFGFPGSGLAVHGSVAFAQSDGTDVLDVTDPTSMQPIGHLDFFFHAMVFRPPLAYATVGSGCINVLDLSDPTNITLVHELCPAEVDFLGSLVWLGDDLYATGGQGDDAALFSFDLDADGLPTFGETTILRASPVGLAAVEDRLVVPYEHVGFDVFVAATVTPTRPDAAPRPSLRVAPNPFRDAVEVRLELPGMENVSVEVFDALGRRLAQLAAGPIPAGTHVLQWSPQRALPAGTYFVRLTTADGSRTQPLTKL